MANAAIIKGPAFFTSIHNTLSEQEGLELKDLKVKRTQEIEPRSQQDGDWSMKTIDQKKLDNECDPSYLQTVSLHFRGLGHFSVPYHARQIDELREVLYFYPHRLPKRLPLERCAPENQDSLRMVVITVEDRRVTLKENISNLTFTIRKKLLRLRSFLKSVMNHVT